MPAASVPAQWFRMFSPSLRPRLYWGWLLLGFIVGGNAPAASENFTNFWRNANWNFDAVRLVGVAMVGSLFSSDAWNNVTFTGAEVRNPRRNLPLALGLGVAIVSALYIATNFVYLKVLPSGGNSERAGRPGGNRGGVGDAWAYRCATDGRCNHDLDIRLRQWPDHGWRPRLLRDGAGQAVLPQSGDAPPAHSRACIFA